MLNVLMLENDADDRYITQSEISELGIPVRLYFDIYSSDLLKRLKEKPSLILLSNNVMQGRNARTIIREIKSSSEWAHIPVIVLTEGIPHEHIDTLYAAGANTVIRKPYSFDDTRKKIVSFFEYWLNVAEVGRTADGRRETADVQGER